MKNISWIRCPKAPTQEFLNRWCYQLDENIYIFFGQDSTTLYKQDELFEDMWYIFTREN